MGITFNADEIFTMAEEIERNGAKFYRKAAKGNAEGKDMLEQLAKMEDQHLATFSSMHKEIGGRAAEATAAVRRSGSRVSSALRPTTMVTASGAREASRWAEASGTERATGGDAWTRSDRSVASRGHSIP